MCQGRGSAANSAVWYALGVTAVDAIRYGLLFERFLSPERDGPPDIDIDIESDRREEVIQHVYETHGREYAAQVANVIILWNLICQANVPCARVARRSSARRRLRTVTVRPTRAARYPSIRSAATSLSLRWVR